MDNQEYAEQFGRLVADDEVVIEFDRPCPDYLIATQSTLNNLIQDGVNVEVWRAWGMKCPHLHIKGIKGLEKLAEPIRVRYKELFIKKYVEAEFMQYADYSLCRKHRVAEENKPHFRYHYKKVLLQHHNDGAINLVQEHLVKRAEIELQKEVFERRHFHNDSNKPGESILKLAEEYGIEVSKHGMALCPFHNDTTPSLSISEEKGIWHCFGCERGGNIAKFKELLEGVRK